MPQHTSIYPAPPNSDELLDNLPPLDDCELEPRDSLNLVELEHLMLDENPDNDDSVCGDLPIGRLIESLFPDAPSTAADDETAFDTGAADLDIRDQVAALDDDDDAQGFTDDDLSIGIADLHEDSSQDEREGALGLDAFLEAQDLPDIDSDDDADLPGGIDLNDGLSFVPEARLPSWADVPWKRAGSPLIAVPMSQVVVQEDKVCAVGNGAVLLAFDSDGAANCRWLSLEGCTGADFVSIHVTAPLSNRIYVCTRHSLYFSEDGGRTTTLLSCPACLSSASQCSCLYPIADSASAVLLVTDDRQLWVSGNHGETWEHRVLRDKIVAVSNDETGAAVALVVDADGMWLYRPRSARSWTTQKLPGLSSSCLIKDEAMLLATRASTIVCMTDANRDMHVSHDAGEHFETIRMPEGVTSICIGETGARCLVLFTVFIESEDRSVLGCLCEDGSARLVADLSPDVSNASGSNEDDGEGMGRASCVAWDAHRGWAWVAGRFGLEAWAPSLPT